MTHIAVATNKGLTVARSENGVWHAVKQRRDTAVQALAADPLNPAVMFRGTFGQGLWRSADVGEPWTDRVPDVPWESLPPYQRTGRDGG